MTKLDKGFPSAIITSQFKNFMENYQFYLQQKYQEPHSLREWLLIFPEAEEYLKNRIIELKIKRDNIQERIINILNNPKSTWLDKMGCKVFFGEDFDAFNKEINNIEWAFVKESKGAITQEMIMRARDYPITAILGIMDDKHNVKCPFHSDNTPSMNVKKNYYFCHACGERGSVIDLVMKLKGLSFIEAVKMLQ